jgi:hypothetical protein
MVDHYRPMNPTEPISRQQLPRSNDTRLLIAGVVAFLALVVYLGVAYARARSSPAVAAAVRNLAKPQKIGPWTARSSNLARVRRTTRGALAIRVVPQSAGLYGIEIKELALGPALRRGFALSVGLRARRPSRLLVQINHGSASPLGYLVNTTAVAGRRWHRFTFRGRLEDGGNRLGLFIGQKTKTAAGRWFEIRRLSVGPGGR